MRAKEFLNKSNENKEIYEASLAAMRDYFAGQGDGYDPLDITKQRI